MALGNRQTDLPCTVTYFCSVAYFEDFSLWKEYQWRTIESMMAEVLPFLYIAIWVRGSDEYLMPLEHQEGARVNNNNGPCDSG